MPGVAAFVRGWFAEPQPPFELREASTRWGRGRPQQARRTLRITDVIQETPSTRTFVLAAPDGGTPAFDYRAGQHLTLLVEIDGATQRRCYSFSTSPLADGLPAITVRRVADGVVSRHLHDEVRAGGGGLPCGSLQLVERGVEVEHDRLDLAAGDAHHTVHRNSLLAAASTPARPGPA